MDKDRGPFLSNPFVARSARWGLLAWSAIGLLILVAVVFRFVLYPIRVIFPPLVVALIVIFVLNPLITRLEQRGVRRILATLLCYVLMLGLVGLALAYLIPAVTDQVKAFAAGIPDLLARAQDGLTRLGARLGVHLDSGSLLESFQPGSGTAANFLGRITSFTSGVFHIAFIVILGPLIAFYLLVDLPKIRRGTEALVPAARREEVLGVADRIGATVGGFFRGQLAVALVVGALCMLGYYVVGLPFYALIGAATALLALVPLLGLVLAAVPVLFVAFTTNGRTGGLLHVSGGWKLALACSIVLILVQQVEARVLSPRLLNPSARLHPVTVVLSLLVGGTLLGLWGMLLAVPVVAALRVILLHVWDTRSQWPPQPAGPAGHPAQDAPPGEPLGVEPAGDEETGPAAVRRERQRAGPAP